MQYDAAVIGLGIMGSAMAGSMVASGLSVVGYDPVDDARSRLAALGGGVDMRAGPIASQAPIVITSLPTPQALRAVTHDLCHHAKSGCIIVECSTLAIEDKTACRDVLAAHDMILLDCPLSGTGMQAAARDLVVLASGNSEAVKACQPVFDCFSRETHFVGAFGNGMKMKLIANLLVAIHNTSAAEALALAEKAGLDPQQTFDVISAGAGTSRMFEVRGPMMVQQKYLPATMKLDVWRKDLDLIAQFADENGGATPLFDVTASLYNQTNTMGIGGEDTAAIRKIFDLLSVD